MRIDLNRYTFHKKTIKRHYDKHKDDGKGLGYLIAVCAATAPCPNIALTFYLAEIIGFTPEIIRIIDRGIFNNKYTEILGQPDNSPYLTSLDPHDIKD